MKIILFSIIFIVTLHAFDAPHGLKQQILEKILTNISLNKELIIWSDDKELIEEFNKKGSFSTTATCEDATLLILENKKNLDKTCQEKAIFVMNYALLKEIPQSFGAMFWKKGRPNIVIIAPRAKQSSIVISEKLDDYLEEKIW